ncbi:MAG: glycosyltransferase family 4 protein [Thermogutta sp.]|uniref:glycosyltransferase family 4 protein n=1 Tax=Thermogutta sp. TaxID=1962930 RepID=UPI0019B26D73|nr:glycosyltransferase family 4 protein [Thermogutta sp.]MBC7351307.1 glycosyltransferase family 4 protein [Thermogutta sp.]
MHILFLTHYFPPEVNAPASRTYEHAVRWVRAGHRVTVITCNPNCPTGILFPGYKNRLRPQRELIDGIEVIRVWTYLAPNAGTVRRIINYLSYMLTSVLAGLWIKSPDVIVATSPQFFCGWAGVILSRLRRRPFVLEIRDIWPESIETVGAIRFRPILRFLQFLERVMYRSADHIVAVGEGYRRKILEKVNIPERISVVMNGVDLERFRPQPADEELRRQWNGDGKFVCAYVGTIGMAHGLDVVLEAAEKLRASGRDDVVFWLVGEGARKEELELEARRRGLEGRVVFTGRLPKEEMPRVIASADACLVHLRKTELFETVIPSKIFEMMAMGKPIIMGVRGEALRIVEEAGAGVAMEPESAESLLACIEKLRSGNLFPADYPQRVREYLRRNYSRDALAEKMLNVICESTRIPKGTQDSPRTRRESPCFTEVGQ